MVGVVPDFLPLSRISAPGGGLGHLMIPDLAEWWRPIVDEVAKTIMRDAATGSDEMQQLLAIAPSVMTGLVAAALLTSSLISLFIGRWWQAVLYNPGGFQEEFHALRLNKSVAMAALGVMLLAIATAGGGGNAATDLAMVMLTLYAVPGLAFVHDFVAIKKASVGWLVGLYFLLVLFMVQLIVVLAFVGIMDSWVNFRPRLRGPSGEPPDEQ